VTFLGSVWVGSRQCPARPVGVRPIRGECGFGKASDRVKAKDHRPEKGFSVVVWWGTLSVEGEKLGRWKTIIGFQSLLCQILQAP